MNYEEKTRLNDSINLNNKTKSSYKAVKSTNRRKGMTLKSVWFKPSEYNKLTDAIYGNDKEKVMDIMSEISIRGDL